jgi:hypothetical protein
MCRYDRLPSRVPPNGIRVLHAFYRTLPTNNGLKKELGDVCQHLHSVYKEDEAKYDQNQSGRTGQTGQAGQTGQTGQPGQTEWGFKPREVLYFRTN